MAGRRETVEFLLKRGANVRERTIESKNERETVMKGDSVQVDARTVDGATALCEACAGGWSDIAHLLITHGALINPSCQLTSPLHEAAMSGKLSDDSRFLLKLQIFWL